MILKFEKVESSSFIKDWYRINILFRVFI